MFPLGVSLSDASSLAANPAAGLLGGGFVFAPVRQLGGTGNRLDNTQSPTASLSQTPAGVPVNSAAAFPSLGNPQSLVPLVILGAAGAIILALVVSKRN